MNALMMKLLDWQIRWMDRRAGHANATVRNLRRVLDGGRTGRRVEAPSVLPSDVPQDRRESE